MSKKVKPTGKTGETKKSLSEEIDAAAPTRVTIILRDDDTKVEVKSSISLLSTNQRVIYKQLGYLIRDLLNKLWPLEIEGDKNEKKGKK